MLATIVALSGLMWYLVDRAKLIWKDLTWGKYVTMASAAVLGFGITYAFGLDLIMGLGIVENVSIAGQVLTGFTLMAGSSAVSEVIDLVQKKSADD